MNEIESQKGRFLMRRIEYTPDVVNIYCDIKIKWLQEIYFYSIINMPKMLFSGEKFNNANIFSKHISIEIEEWSKFVENIVSIFRDNDNLRKKVIKNVNNYLLDAESYIDNIYKKVYQSKYNPSYNELKKCFDFFINMDSFAVFNMFIPSNYYEKILDDLKMSDEYNIDFVMICSFLPHRLQIRREKLKLLKSYLSDDKQIYAKIKDYSLNFGVFEKFHELAFDNNIIINDHSIKSELNRMSKEYSIEKIEQELEDIEINRKNQISRMYDFYNKLENQLEKNKIYKKDKDIIIEKFAFLTLIVSEEERRHMIECKIFAILSEIFKVLKMDISRNSLNKLLETYKNIR